MPTVYGSIRCSHTDSLESGLGLEAQRQGVYAYFEMLTKLPAYTDSELRWGGFFQDDAVSAFRYNLLARPQGAKMNSLLQPGDHVICLRLERMFRQQADFVNTHALWHGRGITLHSATEGVALGTAAGMYFGQIMAATNQFDSARKGERTREAVAIADSRRRAAGLPLSRKAPLGYRKIGKGPTRAFIADRSVWPTMRLVVALRDVRGWSWPQIAERIESLLAKRAGRQPVRPGFGKQQWSWQRCQRAYRSYKASAAA